MVVDERESDGLEGEAEHCGAEEVPGKKRHHRRKAKYCSICEKMVMNVGRHCRDVHKISYNVLSGEGKKKCPLCDKYVKHLVKHLKGAKHDKDDTQVKELVMSLDKRRLGWTEQSVFPGLPASEISRFICNPSTEGENAWSMRKSRNLFCKE
ncbi:unnamed protein product [Clavelina lepadiformis]|uniref:C2H2-type domain-containing protein n=1 Tax=Clavelina lepadiformis TaxID=159417 RepID=A0ABP0FMJ8_CLALP